MDLPAAAKTLHDTLIASIAQLEAQAQECAAIAALAEQDGNQGFADVLRSLSRKHRVGVLGLSAQVALLKAEFGGGPQPKA